MPVRETIQSSLVSTIAENALFGTSFSGKALPVPKILIVMASFACISCVD
jgi:hypothetical protein